MQKPEWLINIMLSERNQTQEIHSIWFHVYEILEKTKLSYGSQYKRKVNT